jgi:hypothetical protein
MGVKLGHSYEQNTDKGVREDSAEEEIKILDGGCARRMGKLKNEELIIQITMVRSRGMRWEKHVIRMIKQINAYRILVG